MLNQPVNVKVHVDATAEARAKADVVEETKADTEDSCRNSNSSRPEAYLLILT